MSEPISPARFSDRLPDYEAVCDGIEGFYHDMRKMALNRGLVISKHVGGVVPDNTKGVVDGVRQRIAQKGKIPVRNPLAIRASSLSIESPKRPGKKLSARARYDAQLGSRLEKAGKSADTIDKWLVRMRFNFERYQQELPPDHVIRYEDICSSRGKALEVIVPAARELDEPLERVVPLRPGPVITMLRSVASGTLLALMRRVSLSNTDA